MATVKPKGQLSEQEKRLGDEIEKKHGKTLEQLYQERQKRMTDAIELRVPDRVPVTLTTRGFAARYGGLTVSAMYYDQAAYRQACKKMILDFEPDICPGNFGASGLTMELLDSKTQRWPGGNLPPDVPYQFVEGEYMKAEEYDLFLSDPSDFVLRYYLPRVFGALAPLSQLPPLRTMTGGGFTALTSFFTKPEFLELADKLKKAGEAQEEQRKAWAGFAEEMAALGFPSQQSGRGAGGAPFDGVADQLRGLRGVMTDIYRCPDKLLAACDKILAWRVEQSAPAGPRKGGSPKITGAPLHRGSDGFMSLKQFEKFYWPGLKKAIEINIGLGYMMSPYFEGRWNDRLEYLLELPKGKVIASFYQTDIARAKDVLGGHMCIFAHVPGSLLQTGSTQDVEEYCKNLIKVGGKGGGFVMGALTSIDEAKPANVKAMVDTVKKYGWY